jgi:hypothetical protein
MVSDIEIADMIRDIVPADGTPIANYAVIRYLSDRTKTQIDRDRYFSVRQSLIARRELEAVHGGYGGRVARTRPIIRLDPSIPEADDWSVERNLYRPFYRYLALHWPRYSGVAIGDKLLVEIIGDARPEGARPWSIPDLVAINCLRYQWPPHQELEVHAFEVKTASGGSDISAYQAFAYSAFAHYTYFCWHVIDSTPPNKIDGVVEACRTLNVGLILCTSPREPNSYQLRHTPSRKEPSRAALDSFIEQKVSSEHKTAILEWVRVGASAWVK